MLRISSFASPVTTTATLEQRHRVDRVAFLQHPPPPSINNAASTNTALESTNTALGSLTLFRQAASIREGSLVWIHHRRKKRKTTDSLADGQQQEEDDDASSNDDDDGNDDHTHHAVAVKLYLLDHDEDGAESTKSLLVLHPTTALNLQIRLPLSELNHENARRLLCDDDNNNDDDAEEESVIWIEPILTVVPLARRVTLRQWARPPVLPEYFRPPTANTQTTNWPQPGSLLQPGKLLVVPSLPDNNIQPQEQHGDPVAYGYTHYEVVEVGHEEGEEVEGNGEFPSFSRNYPLVFRSDAHTAYRLETLPQPALCPQLPPSLQGWPPTHATEQQHKSSETTTTTTPPHPNVPQLVQALQQAGAVPAADSLAESNSLWSAQGTVLVVGTPARHDVVTAVQTAAHLVGRHCLVIDGLAAHVHRSQGALQRSGSLVDKLQGLQRAVDQAYEVAPSVLLLVNLDHEFTATTQLGDRVRHDEEARVWSLLTTTSNHSQLSSSSSSSSCRLTRSVVIVASLAQAPTQGPLLEHVVWETIELTLPDQAYAAHLWSQAFQEVDDQKGTVVFEGATSLWPLLQGRTAQEITSLAREVADDYAHHLATAAETNETRCSACSRVDDDDDKLVHRLLQTRLEERGKNEKNINDVTIPQVKWSDVGGLDHVRTEILETIELPLTHSHLFAPGTTARSGILLYGPPGTGKTLVAKAVAHECGLPFVSVKGPELLGSYVGESEANVRAVFGQARAWAARTLPQRAAIIFFDELDSLAPRRGAAGGGGASVMDRVVATLLTELDRSSSSSHKDSKSDATIFCMGATNRPDMLDPALLRPGRLDRTVYLGLSNHDRQRILEVHLNKVKLALNETPRDLAMAVLESVERDPTSDAVAMTNSSSWSGADLASIVSGALQSATERLCDQAQAESEQRQESVDQVLAEWTAERLEPVVQLDDLLQAAKRVRPSVDESQLARYEQVQH